jgi:hypothetical protein
MTATAGRSIKIKFSVHTGAHTLASPLATPGCNGDASIQIVQITDIPEGVADKDVMKLWEGTTNITWLGHLSEHDGRHVFGYSELGLGLIIRS